MELLAFVLLIAAVIVLWVRIDGLTRRLESWERRFGGQRSSEETASTYVRRAAAAIDREAVTSSPPEVGAMQKPSIDRTLDLGTAPPLNSRGLSELKAPASFTPSTLNKARTEDSRGDFVPGATALKTALAQPLPTGIPAAAEASFFVLLKGNLFAVAGIGLLLLGFAFLLHSIEWGHFLPPLARMGLAGLAALGIGTLGARLSSKNPLWGQVVQGGAAAMAYLTTYIGGTTYQLLSPEVTFGLFALISSLLVWRAFEENSKVLAGVGFIGAYLAPILGLHGGGSLGFNLSYGLLVTGFALSASLRRQWIELGVHAHGCAAILAGLTYAEHLPALGEWQQQVLLHLYLAQFLAWLVVWPRRFGVPRPLSAVLAACLSTAVLVYLGLEHWLVSADAFAAVGLGLGAGLAVLATAGFELAVLKDTAWILAAFSSLAGISTSSLNEVFKGALALAEGLTLTLTSERKSIIRRAMAWLFVAAGLAMLLNTQSHLGIALALVALYGFSLWTSRSSLADSLMLGTGSCVAALAFCASFHGQIALLAPAVLGLSILLFIGVCIGGKDSRLQTLFLGFTALCWTWVLVTAPGAYGWLHALAVSLPLAAGVVGYRMLRNDAQVSSEETEWPGFLSMSLFLIPAVIAEKLGVPALVCVEILTLGACAFSWFEGLGFFGALWRLSRQRGYAACAGNIAPGVLLTAASAFVWWLVNGEASQVAENLGAGLALLATVGTWAVFSQEIGLGVRRVLALSGAIVIGYLWMEGLAHGPQTALASAWLSALLPVLIAAAGVASVWISSKVGAREAWGLAAGVCVLAMAKLLLSLGSAVLSPWGIALSLIGMGALFLMAGYLAPRPVEIAEVQAAPRWLPPQRLADLRYGFGFIGVFFALSAGLVLLPGP